MAENPEEGLKRGFGTGVSNLGPSDDRLRPETFVPVATPNGSEE